jgi:hypothetical protein
MKSFSLIAVNKGSSKTRFDCCFCPVQEILQMTTNKPDKCPFDPNCMSSYVCGAYLTKVKVNDKILDCQKCKICNATTFL